MPMPESTPTHKREVLKQASITREAAKRKTRRFASGHDETPSGITDHKFVPRGHWWDLCEVCGMAEAAHAETTLTGNEHIAYYSDDNPDP